MQSAVNIEPGLSERQVDNRNWVISIESSTELGLLLNKAPGFRVLRAKSSAAEISDRNTGVAWISLTFNTWRSWLGPCRLPLS